MVHDGSRADQTTCANAYARKDGGIGADLGKGSDGYLAQQGGSGRQFTEITNDAVVRYHRAIMYKTSFAEPACI